MNVCGWFEDGRSSISGTEPFYFGGKCVSLLVLTSHDNFDFLCCIGTWSRIFIGLLSFVSLNQRVERCDTAK
jgi:hypothetical protein